MKKGAIVILIALIVGIACMTTFHITENKKILTNLTGISSNKNLNSISRSEISSSKNYFNTVNSKVSNTASKAQNNTNNLIFSNSYNELYTDISKGLGYNYVSGGSYLIGNLNNYVMINGQKYYWVYSSSIVNYNLISEEPLADDFGGNYSLESSGEFVNGKGQKLPDQYYAQAETTKSSEDFNMLNAEQQINQIKQIVIEYIGENVAQFLNTKTGQVYKSGIINLNNTNVNITVNLNNYINYQDSKLYEVNVQGKQGQTGKEYSSNMYVGLDGNIYMCFEAQYAKIFGAPVLSNSQYISTRKNNKI